MTQISLATGSPSCAARSPRRWWQAEGEALQFTLGPIEMELQVQMSREASGKGEVKVWVVSVEVGGKLASIETHKIKLTLTPRGVSGTDVRVGHRKGIGPAE